MVTLSLQLSALTFSLVSTVNNFKSQHLFLFQQQRAGHPFRLVSLLKLHSSFSESHIFLLIPLNIAASRPALSRPIPMQILLSRCKSITANPYSAESRYTAAYHSKSLSSI